MHRRSRDLRHDHGRVGMIPIARLLSSECATALSEHPNAIAMLAECDHRLRDHLITTAALARTLASIFGVTGDDARALELGAFLHDIGKVYVPSGILWKDQWLTKEERLLMQEHVAYGLALTYSSRFGRLHEAIGQHHERFDGRGYPNGLAGDQISAVARALSVLDAYSAMTGNRPYQIPRSPMAALDELAFHAGTQFDPLYTQAFVNAQRRLLSVALTA
jgi:putative nucleotidyltransferase with HDIG domain